MVIFFRRLCSLSPNKAQPCTYWGAYNAPKPPVDFQMLMLCTHGKKWCTQTKPWIRHWSGTVKWLEPLGMTFDEQDMNCHSLKFSSSGGRCFDISSKDLPSIKFCFKTSHWKFINRTIFFLQKPVQQFCNK